MNNLLYVFLILLWVAPSALAQKIPQIPGATVGGLITNPYTDRSAPQRNSSVISDDISTQEKPDELTTQQLESLETLSISSIVPGKYARAQIVTRARGTAGGIGGASMGSATGSSAGGASNSSQTNSQQLVTIPHDRMFLYRGLRLIADVGHNEVTIYSVRNKARDTLVWTGQLSGIGAIPAAQNSTPYSAPLSAGKILQRDNAGNSTSSSSSNSGQAASASSNGN